MIPRLILFACVLSLLGGCGARERVFGTSASAAGELPFSAKLSRGEDRRDVAIRVRAGGVSVDAVRESVRFEATRYCLATYGRSDTVWAIDPASGDWAFQRDGQDMIFNGRCVAR